MVVIEFKDLVKTFLKIVFVSSLLFLSCSGAELNKPKDTTVEEWDKKCREYWESCDLFSYSKKYSTDKKVIAYHEAGHALVAALSKVEIKNLRFDNGDLKDAALTQIGTVPNIYTGLKLYLAGYAAEVLIFGKATYNVCKDLDEAVDDAYRIFSNKILNDNNQTLEEILAESLNAVREMLLKNKKKFIAIAEAFLHQNKLSGQEVLLLIKKIND